MATTKKLGKNRRKTGKNELPALSVLIFIGWGNPGAYSLKVHVACALIEWRSEDLC